MSISKQHFKAIASAIASVKCDGTEALHVKDLFVERISDVLKNFNPNFSYFDFRTACYPEGYWDEKCEHCSNEIPS